MKTFEVHLVGGRRVTAEYDHAIRVPAILMGGDKVTLNLVVHTDEMGLSVSDPKSGKRVGGVPFSMRSNSKNDAEAGKKFVVALLKSHGADKVYSVISKG